MADDRLKFPILGEFFERGFGTLYVLRDSAFRLRDATSALALTRFFAERGVRLDVVPVRAEPGQRYLSRDDLLRVFADDPDLGQQILDNLKTGGLEGLVNGLFTAAAEKEQIKESNREGKVAGSVPPLAPRGPILLLGRPTIFPKAFREQIQAELDDGPTRVSSSDAAAPRSSGRFEMPDDPEPDGTRAIRDTYYNVTKTLNPPPRVSDFGVIRKVRGAFHTRTITFAYGTTSLGTQAAAQVLTDDDQNEELRQRDTSAHFERYGEVEVLVEVKRRTQGGIDSALVLAGMTGDQGRRELRPNELYIKVGPDAPLTKSAKDATEWMTAAAQPQDDRSGLADVYRRLTEAECRGLNLDPDTVWFDVSEGYPKKASATRMVGGLAVRRVIEEIETLVEQAPRAPILFVGRPGTGKELAARVVFETLVKRLIRDLGNGVTFDPPVVVGTGFQSFNCAALVDTLAESLLFGIVKGVAADVTTNPGVILEAGEGVAFLDELSFLTPAQQGKLLRVFEDGHVRPVGHAEVPYSALIVAAMSDDPDDPRQADKLLPALYGRFRGRVVRLPAVADRVGDIPALLTAYAGRPIRMSEITLRGLIAGTYESNVRDLERLVARAERRQGIASPQGVLDITPEDLAGQQKLPRSLGWAHESGERTFGFVLRTVDASNKRVVEVIDFKAFRDASRVLSSLSVHEDRLLVRLAAPSRLVAADEGYNFKDVRMAALQWMRVLRSIDEGRQPSDMEARLRSCLGTLGKARWPAPHQARPFMKALSDVQKLERDLPSPGVPAKRVAWSIGTDPASMSRLGS
jgi:hypothetical protein